MQRYWFTAALALALTFSEPALACRIRAHIALEDIQYADVVVVGRISNYRIIRDETVRQSMLSNPNLTPRERARYEGTASLLSDYARFEIQVDEVLVGNAPSSMSVTWDNSTFGEPEEMEAGPFLIALRRPSSTMPPLRGPSATIFANPEPDLYTLLQAPCARAFYFESTSGEAAAIRRILATSRP